MLIVCRKCLKIFFSSSRGWRSNGGSLWRDENRSVGCGSRSGEMLWRSLSRNGLLENICGESVRSKGEFVMRFVCRREMNFLWFC